MGFETEQGMIGTSSWFFGIVTYSGKLELSVNGQNDGIQIEDETGTGLWKSEEFGSELIVETDQLPDGFGRKSFEETTECRLVWKSGESQ